jgi:beta-glucosidase
MIGTNNLPHDTGAEIGAGIIEVVRTVRRLAPESSVLLIAMPPRGASPDDRENPMRRRGEIANTLARHHARTDPSVVWVDPWAALLDADGRPRDGFLAGDAVHLGPDGYRLWAAALAAHLPNLLEDPTETSP